MIRVRGSCVAIDGAGVLLRGASGSGKSDLALRLVMDGGTLVSDDYTEITVAEGRLRAAAPEILRGLLEVADNFDRALSAHTDENADVTFEALDTGAVDFFTKPGGEVSMEMSRLEDQLVEMVSSVAGADVGDAVERVRERTRRTGDAGTSGAAGD